MQARCLNTLLMVQGSEQKGQIKLSRPLMCVGRVLYTCHVTVHFISQRSLHNPFIKCAIFTSGPRCKRDSSQWGFAAQIMFRKIKFKMFCWEKKGNCEYNKGR